MAPDNSGLDTQVDVLESRETKVWKEIFGALNALLALRGILDAVITSLNPKSDPNYRAPKYWRVSDTPKNF